MKKQYKWLILAVSALSFVLSNAFTIFQESEGSIGLDLLFTLSVAISISVHFSCLYWITTWLQRRYPGAQNVRLRTLRAVIIGVPFLGGLISLTDAWQQLLRGDSVEMFNPLVSAAVLFQALAIGILIIGLSEALYYYEELIRLEKEKEALLRLNLSAQYDSLKQQINPHFLFNSLNTLSSLISLDPTKAEQFVEEMSSVYRYLLQSSRNELSTVGAELSFIRSYLHLLGMRFGPALQAILDVPDAFAQYLIPPLTLQLLVENAVKHNEVSATAPLFLRVSIEGGRLLVSNNLQPKTTVIASEKVGLANIMTGYRLLGQEEVLVHSTPQSFVVSLPLIDPLKR